MKFWKNVWLNHRYKKMEEQIKSIDIALKYTNGDITKAKEMASGHVNDIVVVKGKFLDLASSQSGLVLVFFNIDFEYIACIESMIANNSGIFDRARIFDDWKALYLDLKTFQKGTESIDSTEFNNSIINSVIQNDLFGNVEEGNLESVKKKLNSSISEFYSAKSVQLQIELNKTNSLALDVAGLIIEIPGKKEKEEKEKENKAEETESERRMSRIEQEAMYVVKGNSIVSPVRGKFVNDLIAGDNIKIILSDKDMVSQKILNAVNAYDAEKKPLPVKGRIKEVIPLEKNGFVIYALVAKGILAKLLEEENFKLMMFNEQMADQNLEKSDQKIILLVSLLLGLILLAGIVLFKLL
jgi:hypothetical protein